MKNAEARRSGPRTQPPKRLGEYPYGITIVGLLEPAMSVVETYVDGPEVERWPELTSPLI